MELRFRVAIYSKPVTTEPLWANLLFVVIPVGMRTSFSFGFHKVRAPNLSAWFLKNHGHTTIDYEVTQTIS